MRTMAVTENLQHQLPGLATPVTATYPSELRSPATGTPALIKREENVNTPITPPTAYLDFLKSISPSSVRPPDTAGSEQGESGDMHGKRKSTADSGDHETPETHHRTSSLPHAPETNHPPLSRHSSNESATSNCTASTTTTANSFASSTTSAESAITKTSTSGIASNTSRPRSMTASSNHSSTQPLHSVSPYPMPSPYGMRPLSACAPHSARLQMQIPPSPSSTSGRSPLSASTRSARSHQSPYSAMSPYSPTVTSAMSPFGASPKDAWDARESTNASSSKVSVRQVVTRTITYNRTPLEPAPKGKRRKFEEDQE